MNQPFAGKWAKKTIHIAPADEINSFWTQAVDNRYVMQNIVTPSKGTADEYMSGPHHAGAIQQPLAGGKEQ